MPSLGGLRDGALKRRSSCRNLGASAASLAVAALLGYVAGVFHQQQQEQGAAARSKGSTAASPDGPEPLTLCPAWTL